ncbi:MAG: DUF6868 family protein [Rubripirellula sp.]
MQTSHSSLNLELKEMDVSKLRSFLFWCIVLNVIMFSFWSVMVLAVPDTVYETQKAFLPLTKETFYICMYCFLGAYKLLLILFNIVPYIALRITCRGS